MTDSPSIPTTTRALPSALDARAIGGIVPSIIRCQAIFLDYDGTLTPIVALPELAIMSNAVRTLVRQLSTICPVTIVTGRDIEVVQQLVRLDGLGYVGSHGLDVIGPPGSGLRREVGVECVPALDMAEAELLRETREIPGVVVERKRFSISTHVRQVDPHAHMLVEAAVDRVGHTHPSLRREGGKMLFELRPDVDWDKGAAVRWLLDGMKIGPSGALYIGDDLTDETAFRALAGRGATVVVADPQGSRPTAAEFRLDSPEDVYTLMVGLLAARQSVDCN